MQQESLYISVLAVFDLNKSSGADLRFQVKVSI